MGLPGHAHAALTGLRASARPTGPHLQPQLVGDCSHGRRLAGAHRAGDPGRAAAQAARFLVGVQLLRVLQPEHLDLGRRANTQSAGRQVCCSVPLALRRCLGRMQPHSSNRATAKHMGNTSSNSTSTKNACIGTCGDDAVKSI